ncbi:hypothetical protein GF362_04245 [Candidatus Dojkabacteria bacterium]|nr:hypothetical protein [Candidatus Dojkabacteria bacterium]
MEQESKVKAGAGLLALGLLTALGATGCGGSPEAGGFTEDNPNDDNPTISLTQVPGTIPEPRDDDFIGPVATTPAPGNLPFYPDYDGNGWIHVNENRQEFMNMFGNYLLTLGLPPEDAMDIMQSLKSYDLDNNDRADILDIFYDENNQFIQHANASELIAPYKNFDGDLYIDGHDPDDDGDLIPDDQEIGSPYAWDTDNDGAGDYLEANTGTDPNDPESYNPVYINMPSELNLSSFEIFTSNVENPGEADVIFFPFRHGDQRTARTAGMETEREISQDFLETYHGLYPDKPLVFLLEGIPRGEVVPPSNRDRLTFNYQADEDTAITAGWDDRISNEMTFQVLEEKAELLNPLWEEGYGILETEESTGSPIVGRWVELNQTEDSLSETRNQSLADTIQDYIDQGYTVVVTAGELHYTDDDAQVVRDYVESQNHIVFHQKDE